MKSPRAVQLAAQLKKKKEKLAERATGGGSSVSSARTAALSNTGRFVKTQEAFVYWKGESHIANMSLYIAIRNVVGSFLTNSSHTTAGHVSLNTEDDEGMDFYVGADAQTVGEIVSSSRSGKCITLKENEQNVYTVH